MLRNASLNRRFRPWFAQALIGVLLLATGLAANDRFYVMPDGRKVPLIKSTTELGVVFEDHEAVEPGVARLTARGLGTAENFIDHPGCRVKILRMPDTRFQRRAVAQEDPAIVDVRPVYRFDKNPHPIVGTGTLIAKVRPDLTEGERAALWAQYEVTPVEPVEGQPDVYLLRPSLEDGDELLAAERLAADAQVLWSQPNFRRPIRQRQQQLSIADPFFNEQWHLHNVGQLGGTPGADIDAVEAWAIAEGQDVLFGMFDDACDVDHEDLLGGYIGVGHDPSLPSNAAGFNDPRPKQIFDNHGTQVIGLAVARANGLGGRGVAYQSRFTASRGLSSGLTDAEVASVFTFARQQSVDVHINSWGLVGTPNPAVIVNAIELAFNTGRNKGDIDGDGTDNTFGMVIVFASGNENEQIERGFDLSTVPQVISVGASHDGDDRASYSNFGADLDLLAPSGDNFRNALFTTDNMDRQGSVDNGANVGGINIEIDEPELDPTGSYTGFFSGTSGSCPIAAGVAGLVLSANQLLTASDVRLIMLHTSEPISPLVASYDPITSHSTTHGYGRVNAFKAVTAAQDALTNGGRTWPGSPANVNVAGLELRFQQNINTDEFLVLQSNTAFQFVPQDGACYDSRQRGCGNATIRALPTGVTVLAVGCSLRCVSVTNNSCAIGQHQCADFVLPPGGKFFAVYGRSDIGRYSFGVAADSAGNVRGNGEILVPFEAGPGPGNGGDPLPTDRPSVTITASPTSGLSPLTVNFRGNAVSATPIDESRTEWDFDITDGVPVNARTRNATHTYVVAPGESRVFLARLTMYDTSGNSGTADVSIRVQGEAVDDTGIGQSNVRIVAGLPSNPSVDISEGTSPLRVLLSVDATNIAGTLQSVAWDLGDGTRSNSISVPHIYENIEVGVDLRVAITAIVTSVTSGGTTISTVGTKFLTIKPGTPTTDDEDPRLPGTTPLGPGGAASPCGTTGMLPLLLTLGTLSLLRRRRP